MFRLFVAQPKASLRPFAPTQPRRRLRWFATLLACILLPAAVAANPSAATLSAPAAAAAPAPLSRAEQALLEMEQAFERRNHARLAALLPQVAGHPLEPLAQYWVLTARLESANPDEIRAFLRRWSGTFYENRLRADWSSGLLLSIIGECKNCAWIGALRRGACCLGQRSSYCLWRRGPCPLRRRHLRR